MELTFIIPCYNAAPNLPALVASLEEQEDRDWRAVFVVDPSTDGTPDAVRTIVASDERFDYIIKGDRHYALHNIVEAATVVEGIIAVIDGDDQLCNPKTVGLVRAAHSKPGTVAWTAHRWDINGLNISKEMPQNVNPYQWPWSSSHLRTFDAGLLRGIPDVNFKDHTGGWFQRGYDQALMLPLLSKALQRVYIPEVCYLYRINSCSIDDRDWAEKKQLGTVNVVRARGYLDA